MAKAFTLPPISIRLVMVMVACSTELLVSAQCPAITVADTACVHNYESFENCNLGVYIYEDCPSGTSLFTVEGTDVTTEDCESGPFVGGGASVVLAGELDAEAQASYTCVNQIQADVTFSVLYTVTDVDEFVPTLKDGNPVETLYVEENNEEGALLLSIGVTDPDREETQTFVAQLTSTSAEKFAIEQQGTCDDVVCEFALTATQQLDYETGVFYEIDLEFTSSDQRGDSSSVNMTVMLFLNDASDSPPFWLRIVPTAEFPEAEGPINNIAYVEARDRDTGVNHEICYSIVSGNNDEHFTIDEKTGELSCPTGIDREALIDGGSSADVSFPLELMAVEILNGDCAQIAEAPNNVTQVTNLRVLDVNDNAPTFSFSSLTIHMYELTSRDEDLTNDVFTVTDLDEGGAGTYTLSSDDPTHVGFNDDQGSGVTEFIMKALYVPSDNIFDYESITDGNYDLTFTITATEAEDATHHGEMQLTITLLDVNDVVPQFEKNDYEVNLTENSAEGAHVITVTATDGDTSEQFGTPSVRYYLTQCTASFTIDSTTGKVTVALGAVLDFETQPEIICHLEARDSGGDSGYLDGTSTLTVTLVDQDDTPPILNVSNTEYEVSEGEDAGYIVASVSAVDVDSAADVSFSVVALDAINIDVKNWFSMQIADCEGSEATTFCANLIVAAPLDRETQAEVNLKIVATDIKTDTNTKDDLKVILVKLLDVNDVAPVLCTDCTQAAVYENEPSGTAIARITAQDQDLNDILTFNCSGDTHIEINATTGILSVAEPLDREETPEVSVTVTVTDAIGHTDIVNVTITVKDRNDNSPELSSAICEDVYTVSEAAGDGTSIVVVTATDNDEGAHEIVSFYPLKNAQDPTVLTPFSIDATSGEITVSTDPANYLELDREEVPEWFLLVQAYDHCEDLEPSCQAQQSTCVITVQLSDINDETPFLSSPVFIPASEALLEGDDVPESKITAVDKDLANTTATEIHYVVTNFAYQYGDALELAFKAIDVSSIDRYGNMEWSCTLQTTKNLTHMAGIYNLTLTASDGAEGHPENTANLTITIEITDVNDYTPVIDIEESCLNDTGRIIRIPEETYGGGDCLPCLTGSKDPLEITYEDGDADPPNNEVKIVVYPDTSVVYPVGAPGQLDNFIMKEYSQVYNTWRLCLKDGTGFLDLESAEAYNLTLKVEDKGTPSRSSFDWIFVNLTSVSEFPPKFGDNVSDCYATTYVREETTEIASFRAAEDEDNMWQENDQIFYYLVEGEAEFDIQDSRIPELQPKRGLDRDDGPGEYTVLIQATNVETRTATNAVVGDKPTDTSMLQLTVILMDQNDNAPEFFSPIFYGSVLQSGSTGQLAVELLATDKDLNETLTYEMTSTPSWEPSENYGNSVFEIRDDTMNGTVWLIQDPGSLLGYCTFTARVSDRMKDEHQDTTFVQIFVLKSSDEVPFSFKNDIATLQQAQHDLEMILSETFGYFAFVDSMSPTGGSDNTTEDSVVEVHFVNGSVVLSAENATAGNLVSPSIIESMASSALISSQLQAELAEIGLELYQVGDAALNEPSDLETQLLTYQIILAVVTIVLLSIVFLLGTAYCVRTRKLERRVKVLTTNTFGSQSSDLNKTGVTAAPNSNLFKGEGTNPMFNISLQEFNKQETGSLSSGDSVLVGVEDNDEFRDYDADKARASKAATPAFVGTDGIASTNPLFAVVDQPSAPGLPSDDSDAGSYNDGDLGNPNPNFIFQ